MVEPTLLTGYQSARHVVLFRNPKPHVRSIQAYFPSVIAFDTLNLGATVVLGEAFEAPNLHLAYFESQDGGISWSRKSTVTEPSLDYSTSTTGRLNLLPDGSLSAIVTRHQRSSYDEGLTEGKTIAMLPAQVEQYRSTDRGASWQGPEIIAPPIADTTFEICSGFTFLQDGTFLWPTSTWPTVGHEVSVDQFETGAFVSHDQGQTWPRWMPVFPNDQNIYWESKIVPLPDQRLLAVAWGHHLESGQALPNHYAIGNADGSEWSAPRSMGTLGQTLSSVVLPDGRILSVYRRVDRPGLWGTTASLEGETLVNQEHVLLWGAATGASSDPDKIRQHFATLKFGAPSIIRLPNDDIFIAFWAVVDGVSQINTITLSKS